MEKDAQKKMEKAISKEKQRMQQELDALKRDKQRSDEQKRLAEEARTAAERARALADEERNLADQEREKLQKEIDKTHDGQLAELVRAFRRKQREDDDDTDSDGDQPPKPKHSKAQSSEFDAEGLLKKTPEYKGMNISGLVLFKSVNDDIRRAIGRNEFFPLAKMYTGEEITTSQLGHMTVTTTTKNMAKTITKKSELLSGLSLHLNHLIA